MIDVFFFIAFAVLAIGNYYNAYQWNRRVAEIWTQDLRGRGWGLSLDIAYTQFMRDTIVGSICVVLALTSVLPISTMADIIITLNGLLGMIYFGSFWTAKHPSK